MNKKEFEEIKSSFEWKKKRLKSLKCSCCGNIKKDLTLKDREYICDACGLIIDRDMNASLNIEAEGLRLHELMLTG